MVSVMLLIPYRYMQCYKKVFPIMFPRCFSLTPVKFNFLKDLRGSNPQISSLVNELT